MNLSQATTAELVEELKKRDGVVCREVAIAHTLKVGMP